MAWFSLVFIAIMYYYIEVGIMLTYGSIAWEDELGSASAIFFDCFFIIVFILDMLFQLNSGFLYRGMIIMDKERAIGRYLRNSFLIDSLLIIFLVVALASQNYNMNYPKLIVIAKFIRMF